MKKSRGFTLMELVAVIVVLAIIMLIAVPIIINTIDKTNRNAYKETAKGVIRAIENETANAKIELPVVYDVEDNSIRKANSTDESEVEYSGEIKSNGHVYINGYESSAIYIANNKYCAIKNFTDKDISIYKNNSEECKTALETSGKWYLEVVDYTVEIGRSFLIPVPEAKDNEGEDLEIHWKITNLNTNNLISEDKQVIEEKDTGRLNDVFEIYYKAFDPSINKERSLAVTVKVVDTIKPSIAASINSTTSTYASNIVDISIDANDNGTKTENLKIYYTTENEIAADSNLWQPYSTLQRYTVDSSLSGNTKDVKIQVMDEAGNITSTTISYTVYKECYANTSTSYGNYGSCSSTCGGGSQSRTVTTTDTLTGKTCSSYSDYRSCGTSSCSTTTKKTTTTRDQGWAAGENETIVEKMP